MPKWWHVIFWTNVGKDYRSYISSVGYGKLTHWGRVTHLCVANLRNLWLGQWPVGSSTPIPNLNQSWLIVSWTIENIFWWTLNQNATIFVEENECVNVVCKLVVILFRPQCISIYSQSPCVYRLGSSKVTLMDIIVLIISTHNKHRNVTSMHNSWYGCFNPTHDDVVKWKHFPSWQLRTPILDVTGEAGTSTDIRSNLCGNRYYFSNR